MEVQDDLQQENNQVQEESKNIENNILIKILLFFIPNWYDTFNVLFAYSEYSEAQGFSSNLIGCVLITYILTHCAVPISKWLLNIARPSAYLTKGFWDSIAKKFFWNFGPQTITAFMIAILIYCNSSTSGT